MATVVRVVKNCNYTTLSNYHFKDKRLSWKAKGLLSTMLSLPPDWNYTIEGLATLSGDGIKSTNSGLAELEKYGYLKRKQLRDDNGHFLLMEYTIYEEPIETKKLDSEEQELDEPLEVSTEDAPLCQNGQTVENTAFSPLCQKRQTEKRFAEKGVQLNTNILNTKELNTYNSSSSTSMEYAVSHMSEEEENNLRERLKLKALARKCSAELVEAVFKELCKRDKEFQNLITAEVMEELSIAILEKHQREPIRMLPNFINKCLDNIICGIKAASSGGKPLRKSKYNCRNEFNNFEQHEYSDEWFEELEHELLRN